MCRDVEYVHHSGGWIETPKWIDGTRFLPLKATAPDGRKLVAHDLNNGHRPAVLVWVPANEGWEEWSAS